MKTTNFPPGWDRARVMKVIEHYESQTDEEAAAEIESWGSAGVTTMDIPVELVPEVKALIAKNSRKPAGRRKAVRRSLPARRRTRA